MFCNVSLKLNMANRRHGFLALWALKLRDTLNKRKIKFALACNVQKVIRVLAFRSREKFHDSFIFKIVGIIRCFLLINIDVILRHAHFIGWQKERDSENVNSLRPVGRSRYYFKLSYDKGASSLSDPYNLKRWTNNLSSWPDWTFGDLYTYLIETIGIYTKESLRAFESLVL